jgi:membrane protein
VAADVVPWRQVLRRLPRATRHELHGTDLPLHGAALTFYAALAVVPVVLVTGRLAAMMFGEERVRGLARSLQDALPKALDAGAVARTLIESAVDLGLLGLVVGVLPASLYGEGLRRACASLGSVDAGSFVGWRGRLGALPVVVVAPALLVGVLAVTPLLDDLIGTGLARTALGTYIALNVSWVAVSVVLAWVFVAVVPDAPPARQAVTGAVVTGAFVAGFLQGFVLFLSLPIDLGLPFGGLVGVGAVVAVLLWMWVLHLVVLVGWAATRVAGRLRLGVQDTRVEHMVEP